MSSNELWCIFCAQSRVLQCVRYLLADEFSPYHTGFGPEHWVTLDVGSCKRFTKEFVFEELVSWMRTKIADNFEMRLSNVALDMVHTFIFKSLAGFKETRSSFSHTSFVPCKKYFFCHNTRVHNSQQGTLRRPDLRAS